MIKPCKYCDDFTANSTRVCLKPACQSRRLQGQNEERETEIRTRCARFLPNRPSMTYRLDVQFLLDEVDRLRGLIGETKLVNVEYVCPECQKCVISSSTSTGIVCHSCGHDFSLRG